MHGHEPERRSQLAILDHAGFGKELSQHRDERTARLGGAMPAGSVPSANMEPSPALLRMRPPLRPPRLPARALMGLAALVSLGATVGSCSCSDPSAAPPVTTGPAAPSTSGRVRQVVTVPATIPSDCSADASADVNRWLGAVPDGATAALAGGCYRIDHPINLVDRGSLTVDGGGATFQTSDPTGDASTLAAPSRAARTRDQWHLTRGHDVRLTNLAIRGANPAGGQDEKAYVAALEAQQGIDISGTQRVDIDHVTITDVYGDFIYFGPDTSGPAPVFSSGQVHNSHLERNGRQGIAITGGHGIQIDHNVIGDTAPGHLRPRAEHGRGVGRRRRRHRTQRDRCRPAQLRVDGRQRPRARVRISDNILHRPLTIQARGSGPGMRSSLTVTGNVSDASWGTRGPSGAMDVQGIDDVTVTGNTQPLQAGRGNVGVSLQQVTGGRVEGNRFLDAASATLLGPDAVGVTSCGNQLVANGPFDRDQPCPAGTPGTTSRVR